MKKQAALLIGMAAMMGVAAPAKTSCETQSRVQQQITNQQVPVKAIAGTVSKKKKLGTGFFCFENQGIPPHIYGMYHLRKGTHKKTNQPLCHS